MPGCEVRHFLLADSSDGRIFRRVSGKVTGSSPVLPTNNQYLNSMVKEITVDENYQTVRLFDAMKKGDIYKVPYDKKRHNGIKLEASRRNRDLRLLGILKNKMDAKYRVSATEYPGFSAIICLK